MMNHLFLMIVLAALGIWLSATLDHMWWESVISGVTFGEPYGIDLLTIVGWVPSLLVFACLGAAFARVVEPATTVRWTAGLGALGSAYWFYSSQLYFPESPATIDVAWAYSQGLVPLFASVIGWWLMRRANKAPHPTLNFTR
jgi:hypothetical protein